MKIVILKGSPRKRGNSNYLADQFAKGAAEAGHEVIEFDCTKHRVGGCMACNACGMNGPCVQKDDFAPLREQLLAADAIVLAHFTVAFKKQYGFAPGATAKGPAA